MSAESPSLSTHSLKELRYEIGICTGFRPACTVNKHGWRTIMVAVGRRKWGPHQWNLITICGTASYDDASVADTLFAR